MKIYYFATQKNVSRKVKIVIMFFFLLCVQNSFAQGLADLFLDGIEAMKEQNEKQVKTIKIRVKNGLFIEMVKVEAGTFVMGATPEMENSWDSEKPHHQVTLTRNYYIGKFEVTQALWKCVMGNNPSWPWPQWRGNKLPVNGVSWTDCQKFIAKLNRLTGKKFRLPTEAEWEYAAKGGQKSCGYKYSGSDNASDVAWFADNSGRRIQPVGTKQPNELGIYDMSGNISEWCQDRYGEYSNLSQINPTGPIEGKYRVYRGGNAHSNAIPCLSFFRSSQDPDSGDPITGFRLALSE